MKAAPGTEVGWPEQATLETGQIPVSFLGSSQNRTQTLVRVVPVGSACSSLRAELGTETAGGQPCWLGGHVAHSSSCLAFWFTFLSFKFSQLISASADFSAAQRHLSGCAGRGSSRVWSCFVWPTEDSSPSGRKGIVLTPRKSKVTQMLPALVSLVPTAVLGPRAGAGTLGSQARCHSGRRGLTGSAPALSTRQRGSLRLSWVAISFSQG